MRKLSVGWAETDITPEGKVDLYGQYYPRESQGIHSRLSATVLVLENNCGEITVMISIDLLNFSTEFLDKLRAAVKTAIPRLETAKIIMNAIHTHSAPTVAFKQNEKTAVKYRDLVIERITEAVVRALNARQASGIADAAGFASVGHCRRAVYENGRAEMYGDTSRKDFTGMEGNEDSTVETVFFFDGNKRPTGAIVNVACPSQVMEATYYISSDFMGEVRQRMKEKFGAGFCTLCQISAAGCQSPRDLISTRNDEFWSERGVKVLGGRIFTAALEAFEQAKSHIEFEAPLLHDVTELVLPKRKVSDKQYKTALKNLRDLEAIMPETEAFAAFCAEVKTNEKITGRPGPYDSKLHHFVLIKNNKADVARYEEQQQEPDFRMELHVLRLGKMVFVTNPFELFLDYGLQIKARSRAFRTFVIQLSCGSGGYLPTKRAEAYGGYGGLVVNGAVGSDGGRLLVNKTLEKIEKLWK
ncbi:MAG: hypothetical protein PHV59_04480 [Victivallales bacterium]|nr:hypothetical protein [Victivallales bacterium]